MNTNLEAPREFEKDDSRFSKFIVRSTAGTLGIMLAVAFLMAAPRANAATAVSTADQDFMLAAGQVNLTEMKLGEYAVQNGKRDDVKEFGQRMVRDHADINDGLKSLAAQKTVTMPDSLDAAHQKMVDKLTALTGSDFDNAYIAEMFKGHKRRSRHSKPNPPKRKMPMLKASLINPFRFWKNI